MQSDETERIKSALDIVDIIGKTISIKHTGNGIYRGAISASSKSGTSLYVDQKQQLYHDFPSGKGGDVYNWIALDKNININTDFLDVLKIAAELAGIELEYTKENIESATKKHELRTLTTAIADYYHSCLTPEHRALITKQWGITDETIDRLKIGFAIRGNQLIKTFGDIYPEELIYETGLIIKFGDKHKDLFNGRIVFPYWKNGQVVYFIGRQTDWTPNNKYEDRKYIKQLTHSDKYTYVSPHVANQYFYGEDTIRGAKDVLITEGVTDCIMAMQNNIPCISPVTTTIKNVEKERALQLVKRADCVYICNDNDDNEAGIKGATATAEYLAARKINVLMVELPKEDGEDKIDLAEYLRDNTKDEFNELLVNAKSVYLTKLEAVKVNKDPVRAAMDALRFAQKELTGLEKVSKNTFISAYIKNHFNLKSKQVTDIISTVSAEDKNNLPSPPDGESGDTETTDEPIDFKEKLPPHIIEIAHELLKEGDPMQFILDTWGRVHVGDVPIGEVCCVGTTTTMINNSKGLHIKPSGKSGKGKSDAIITFLHLLPSEKYINGSLSGKSLFYMNGRLKKGTIVFSDDAKLNEDIVTTIKQTTTFFQQPYTHYTVTKDLDGVGLEIPERIMWALTSVDGFDDDQMGNRFVGIDVNETEEQDNLVFDKQVEMEITGTNESTVDEDVLICRAVIQLLNENEYYVQIPFVKSIIWNNRKNRRNFAMFKDIIKAVTIFKKEQRKTFKGAYISTLEDFDRAKAIYDNLEETNATNLTERELKLVKWLADENKTDGKSDNAGYRDILQIQDKLLISNTTARNLLHGRNNDGGLLLKIPGLKSDKIPEKRDDVTTNKRYYWYKGLKGLDFYGNVVSLNSETVDESIDEFMLTFGGV